MRDESSNHNGSKTISRPTVFGLVCPGRTCSRTSECMQREIEVYAVKIGLVRVSVVFFYIFCGFVESRSGCDLGHACPVVKPFCRQTKAGGTHNPDPRAVFRPRVMSAGF